MPVRKKDGKWYWGKQGPFDSKTKAEEVAQAAYASGYKKAWLTNPRGSTDDDKHDDADEERNQGFRYKKAMGGWGRGGQQEGTKPTIARSKNRKLDKDLSFGNPQGDSLKRGAYWDEQVEDDDEEEESAVQKLMNYQQGRSANHPSYPPTHGGLLGPKRIDWKKKRNTQPTEFVEKNLQRQLELFEMPDFWISKFIDITRQRGLAYILKESEDDSDDSEVINTPNDDHDDQPITGQTPVRGAVQWDTTTMGPLPPDKVEITDPKEAPEGTRLIQGPRGGLYYIGDASGTTPEMQAHGKTFNARRKELMNWHEKQIAPLQRSYDQLHKEVADALTAEIEKFSVTSSPDVEQIQEIMDNNPKILALKEEAESVDAQIQQKIQKQNEKTTEAINSLFRVFSSSPIVEGLNLDINPDVQLEVDPDSDQARMFRIHVRNQAHKDFYTTRFREDITNLLPEGKVKAMQMLEQYPVETMFLSGEEILRDIANLRIAIDKSIYVDPSFHLEERDALKAEIKTGMSRRGNDRKLSDKQILENKYRLSFLEQHEQFISGRMKHQIEHKNLGGYYKDDENTIQLNPSHVAALFGSDPKEYMAAMHTVTHELLHSGTHGETAKRDRHEVVKELLNQHSAIRNTNKLTQPVFKLQGEAFHLFIEESPIEILSHIVLGNRYGQKHNAKNRQEADRLQYLPGTSISYGDMIPTFAHWILAKNNDSPKEARKDVVRLLHDNDPAALMQDFMAFHAVGNIANKANKNRPNRANLSWKNTANAAGWVRFFGGLDVDAFEAGDLKRFKPGSTEQPESIDMPDYIKYNKKNLEYTPTDMDIKWLLYGERD